MTLNRLWLALFLAGFWCALENASAQGQGSPSDSGSAGTPAGGFGFGSGGSGAAAPGYPGASGGAGASSSSGFGFGSGSTGGSSTGAAGAASGNSSAPEEAPSPSTGNGTGTGAASSFGTPSSDAGLGATGGGASVTGSQASTQGSGFGTPKAPSSEAPSFTLPGFYGSSATTFTAGQGRLARPRFEYKTSLSLGYDDNVFQTPTNSQGSPAISVPVEVEPAMPAQIIQVQVFRTIPAQFEGGTLIAPARTVPDGFKNVFVPATPPKVKNVVVVPAQPAAERIGSAVTQASASANIQIFTARSLFTFDINGSANQYWNRPGSNQIDFNGATVFNFLYRITPRFQFTAQLNAAYLSQPDLSRINTPQQQNGSDYFTANSKIDLTYRWNRRITSVFSISDNSLLYQDAALETNDYNETVLGTELRYLWGPRLTLLTEARYSEISYKGSEARDADTVFALIGAETRLSMRFSGSLRLGVSMRTFQLSGEQSSTPYLESSVAYRSGPTSVWNLSTRFGFEEPLAAGQERRVLRTGLSYSRAFSPRLSGVASSNYLVETTTAGNTSLSSSSYDANARLEYRFTKAFSVNSSVNFTKANFRSSLSDYYRTRYFFGIEYTF